MRRLIDTLLGVRRRPWVPYSRAMYRVPEPPLGFVRRSDPNFYFLARKF
ncbi:MAG TPA: hypothetical protein VLF67_05160 [Candidatus Saccharimonas sp.]|nr:hypothetical protein [Candidatus Saccharimonas sp.]